mmetsp:Transcript_6079/g.19177  ORF Transcript_6079/g.19177 Transcript_6079/m.19177 type:complete len:309 (-) Transcript_6079:22-948(-)
MLAARKVLSVRGADAAKLLQGLCSSDVHAWLGGDAPGLATAFLTNKGRVLADALFWRERDDGVLVDVAAAHAPRLLKHLKMYKLRAMVRLAEEADLGVRAYSAPPEAPGLVAGGVDPRTPFLGGRGVVEVGAADDASELEPLQYLRRRLALGVAEGEELAGRIPLNCNLDYLNGVAFDKGCYLGQELTARAKFRGEVRRRLMPVALHETDVRHSAARALPPPDPVPGPAAPLSSTPDVGAKLLDAATGSAVGELVAWHADSHAAVAMVKLDYALSGDVLDVDVDGAPGVKASPYVPPFWPEDDEEGGA